MGVLLWRFRPDLLHVHWAHFAVQAARVWSGPLAVTAWGSDIYRYDRFTEAQWSMLAGALDRANLVTCNSTDLAGAMHDRTGIAREKVKVLQWGVDTDQFAPGASALASELDLPRQDVVLSIRNFEPIYNQESVIEAFAIARKSVPSAFLLMKNHGGNADYIAKIRTRIRELDLVDHIRIIESSLPYERMPELYRAAAVTISIPHSDATSSSLLEAMSCGSLPLVSDLPAMREWIAHRENGYLVAPTDIEAIAACIVDGLRETAFRSDAAERNRRIAVERASQDTNMQRCLQLYSQMLSASARDRSPEPVRP
jgi:glycosyltransferase involved in cell wall biosynthesis